MALKNFFKIELDKHRVYGLDILRCFAILFVVFDHSNGFLSGRVKDIFESFVFDGVSIFFVLSGFLIGGILLKTLEIQKAGFKTLFDFWIRRWFRTLPNYILVLTLLCILTWCFGDPSLLFGVYKYFIFSQNFASIHPPFFPEAWSLSVEEWFYLLIPAFVIASIVLFRISPKMSIFGLAIFVLVFVTAYRFSYHYLIAIDNIDKWDLYLRKQVITRLDSIMYGVIGAFAHFYYKRQWLAYKNFLFVAGITLIFISQFYLKRVMPIQSYYNNVFSFSLTSFATLLTIPFLSEVKSGRGFIYQSVTYISVASYSMYLLNLSVIKFFIIDKIDWGMISSNLEVVAALKYMVFWVLVVLLSILLYKYFEMPVTSLREKFKKAD